MGTAPFLGNAVPEAVQQLQVSGKELFAVFLMSKSLLSVRALTISNTSTLVLYFVIPFSGARGTLVKVSSLGLPFEKTPRLHLLPWFLQFVFFSFIFSPSFFAVAYIPLVSPSDSTRYYT